MQKSILIFFGVAFVIIAFISLFSPKFVVNKKKDSDEDRVEKNNRENKRISIVCMGVILIIWGFFCTNPAANITLLLVTAAFFSVMSYGS